MAETAGIGHNGLPDQGKAFVERVERLNGDIDREKESIEESVKAIRGDIREVMKEAKRAGLKAAVAAAVKARKLEKKAATARENLDIADRDTFDNIRLKLGDLAETDLGKAALEKVA